MTRVSQPLDRVEVIFDDDNLVANDKTGDNTASVAYGLRTTAGIITGAALIMVAVFAGFASGQLVMFQQMGFGLGVAVLLDATIVRCVLVPASMKLLGSWNWYLPAWLGWLPRLRVEGPTPRPDREPAVPSIAYLAQAEDPSERREVTTRR